MSAERVLVGDVGGTNARLATAEVSGNEVTLHRIEVRSSSGFAGLAELVRDYARGGGQLPRRACFALAGPIRDNAGFVTNVGWAVEARQLEAELDFSRVLLMNDFAALANAVPSLGRGEVATVKHGTPKTGEPISVMGAGTGFGVCLLAPCNSRYALVPTEGGHASFAPSDALELRIWQQLRDKTEHVSVESILSGPGLARLYAVLSGFDGAPQQRSPEDICRSALEDRDSASARTLEVFCNILGGVAGNIVLTQGARGGVYLGGGVLMKNSGSLLASRFAERFIAKDLMASYLAEVPVYLIRAEYAALKGAALYEAYSA